MRTDFRSLLFGFTFFFVITTFFSDFLLFGSYADTNTFPSTSLFSWTTAYSTAYTAMGGGGSTAWIVGPLINWFAGFLAYPIGAFVWIGDIFAYLIGGIVWFFGLVTFPFKYVPYPFGTLVTVLFYGFIGISILTAFRGPTGIGIGGGER